MPRYSKNQLEGFVADRRYWDKNHPEHQAHLDFTVNAFEQTYPDPLMPTKEQEEWAAREEKRLRERAKLRPFWDKRDPGHAEARAAFYRGFDKINAALYGPPENEDGASEEPPKPAPLARKESMPPLGVDLLSPSTRTAIPYSSDLALNHARARSNPSQAPESIMAMHRAAAAASEPAQTISQTPAESQQALSPFWQRPPAPWQAPREPVPMPPRVIHPDIKLPDGWDPKLLFSPLQVSPEQIEELWKQLDDPKTAFERFKESWKNGTGLDPATGQLRPLTEQELRNSFERDQDLIKEFLWDYYHKRDRIFPEERERVNPDSPSRDKDEYNPDDRHLG